ncbi:MAG: VOC family protein [Methylocystaceae bacterium]
MTDSIQKIHTFFMFTGQAEAAMNYYISLFNNSKIIDISYYGANEEGSEGTVRLARFALKGQEFLCIDSSISHAFTFTPSISLYVTCENEAEIDSCFAALSQKGVVLMPLGVYPFSQKFAWVQDKFGVSWQLTL